MLKKIRKILFIISIPSMIMIMVFFATGIVAMGSELGITNIDALNSSMKGSPTVNSQGVQAILDWCQVIGEYMRDNHYYYPKNDAGELDPGSGHYDIRYNDGKSDQCCCATYVSWVLQEAGLIDKHTNYVGDFNTWLGNDKENWKKIDTIIQVEKCDDDEKCFQPGDILIFDTDQHVNIYAGDGKFWDAGDDRDPEDIKKGAFKGYAKPLDPFSNFKRHPYSYTYRYIGKQLGADSK